MVGHLPETVGPYEIVLQIARGGMATVYLARAQDAVGADRYVALKLTAEHLRDDPEFAHHLVEEAKLVRNLHHPNVVPVLDVGEDDLGAVYLVMEYIPGNSLSGLFRTAAKTRVPVPRPVGLRILVDALAGLHAAHEHTGDGGKSHRIVHRDFSPQNILVGTDGIARLTDFGIAKAASRASITIAGTVKGKISYASPEQAAGETLDRRCDVWAGGVIAWEILAGRKLYPSAVRTLLDIVRGPPPKIRQVMPDVPEELERVIAAALAMDVDARTPTAEALAHDLATAARKFGMLADVEEVAAHCQVSVAPLLSGRKEKILEAKRLPVYSSPELAPVDLSGETVAMVNRPLPPLPETPMVTERIDAAMRLAVRQANDSTSLPLPAWEHPSPHGISDPPVCVASTSPRRPEFTRLAQLKGNAVGHVTRFATRRPMVVLVCSGLLMGSLLVAAMITVANHRSNAKGRSAFAGSPATALVAPIPAPVTAPASPPGPTLEEAELPPPQLDVSANAPIAKLRVGNRVIDMEVAAPKVAVELLPEESTARLPLIVFSNDGRVARGVWSPGDSSVALAFEKTAAPKAPPRPSAAPSARPKPR